MKYLLPNKHPSPADSLLTKGTILPTAEDAQFPWNSLEDEGAYCTAEGIQRLTLRAQHLSGSGPKHISIQN